MISNNIKLKKINNPSDQLISKTGLLHYLMKLLTITLIIISGSPENDLWHWYKG